MHVHQIRAQPRQQRIEIGGDFDEAETLAWVSKYFGSILRGPDVAMPDKPAVTLDADRYLSLEDNVALPLMQIAFPTVHRFHPDEAPLDVLMYVLGVGETSLLYKNMVSNRLAVQAQANHGCRELSCTFAVIALPNPTAGQTLADLERIARDSLVELETRGVLNESTERSTVEALSDRLQMLGSTVQFRAGNDATTATVRSLTRNLDETLAIFAEKLLEPKFDPADFARVQQQTMQAIALSRDQAGATAQTVYDLLLLGRDNPVAHPDMGAPDTVGALTVDDARAFYAARYSPSIASLVVVSDLDEAELRPKLAALEAWQGPAVEPAGSSRRAARTAASTIPSSTGRGCGGRRCATSSTRRGSTTRC